MAGVAFDIHRLPHLGLGPLFFELTKHILIEVWLIKCYEITMNLPISP